MNIGSLMTFRLLAKRNINLNFIFRSSFCTAKNIGKCFGCGIQLQTSDVNQKGYISLKQKSVPLDYVKKREKMEKMEILHLDEKSNLKTDQNDFSKSLTKNLAKRKFKQICVRCHQLRFQGKVRSGKNMDLSDFWNSLEKIMREYPRSAILLIIDIFDFNGTILKNLKKIVNKDHPVVIAINKIDLIPVNCSKSVLNKWALLSVKNLGLWIHEVMLISGKDNVNLGRLQNSLVDLSKKNIKEIFVVGTTNVGKSTLINSMRMKKMITTVGGRPFSTASMFPGTTLDTIEYSLVSQHSMVRVYDTPGILNSSQLACRLNFDELRELIPTKRLKPRTFKLATKQTLILGAGLGTLSLVGGEPIYCTIYLPGKVSIHITRTENVENMIEKHTGKILFPPFTLERAKELGKQQSKTAGLTGRGWNESVADIVYSGLCWISLTSCGKFQIEYGGVGKYSIEKRDKPWLPYDSKTSYKKFLGRPK